MLVGAAPAIVYVVRVLPGERPTGRTVAGVAICRSAVEEQAGRDGGLTGSADPFVSFYHDRRERGRRTSCEVYSAKGPAEL
ncbi:hypothetical protein AB0F88_30315 [Streptosporangium sp. NPDC023963]|uniref:hypothetical protein n=1 Tax=Streptosporangium sp. NPDC023963 TaxID=3155608 RepID=UPI00342CD3CD